MDEHMVIDFSGREITKSMFRLSPYFIHSKKRDFSFTPGLKSSLLKLSLLVNGSMPTLQCGSHQTTTDSRLLHLRGILVRLTSCPLPMTHGSVTLLRYICKRTNFNICARFLLSGKFCVVESNSVWK